MCNGLNCPYETPKGQCKKTADRLRNEKCPHELEAEKLKQWEHDTAMEHKRDERENR